MREFIKGVCIVLIAAGGFVGALAWVNDRPEDSTWIYRFAGPTVAFVGLAWFLVVHFQRDAAPDFLHSKFGKYFERNGFCFQLQACSMQGVCFLDIWFQNRRDMPSIARVSLRPPSGFFRRSGQALTLNIDCDAAAFGVARIPLPVPQDVQGSPIKLEIGANCEYPDGKGTMLRARHDAFVLRTDAEFRNALRKVALWTYFLAGHPLHLIETLTWKPDSVVIEIPNHVATSLPPHLTTTVTILWRLGDGLTMSSMDSSAA